MILLRHHQPSDLGFIFSSWIRSSRSAFNGHETEQDFSERRRMIGNVIHDAQVLVACPSEDEGTILGWICFHSAPKPRLDYLYVRDSSRKEGLCRMLCKAAFKDRPFTCVNPTPRFKLIAPKLGCETLEVAWPATIVEAVAK